MNGEDVDEDYRRNVKFKRKTNSTAAMWPIKMANTDKKGDDGTR